MERTYQPQPPTLSRSSGTFKYVLKTFQQPHKPELPAKEYILTIPEIQMPASQASATGEESFARRKKQLKTFFFEGLQNYSFNMGHICITYVEVIQQYFGPCDFAGNSLETCWECIGLFYKFVGSNTSLNKSSQQKKIGSPEKD